MTGSIRSISVFFSALVLLSLGTSIAAPAAKLGVVIVVPNPGIFVLSIGIDKYDSEKLPDQRFAVADAVSIGEQFAKPLKLEPVARKAGIYKEGNVTLRVVGSGKVFKHLIKDAEVSRESIAAAFETIAREIDADDVFVFNFAGLGHQSGKEFMLFTPGATDLNDPNGGIRTSELQVLFRKVRAKNKVIIMDSCDSTAGYDAVASAFVEPDKELGKALNNNILFVGSEGLAYEDPSIGHGVITQAVLEGISGAADADKNGSVSARELEAYVPFGVLKYPQSREVRPRTIRIGDDFDIAVTDKKREELAAKEKGGEANEGPATVGQTRAKVYSQTPIADATKPRDGDDYALLFANDKYDNPHWNALKNPVNDVNDIAKELRERYGFKEVVIKENLTTKEIRDTLTSYQARQFERPDDQLFVFFAGHGVTHKISDIASNSYYVGRSSPPFSLEDSGHFMPLDLILQMIAGFRVSHVLTVFDTCYAGQIWKPAVATYTRRASFTPTRLDNTYAGIAGEQFGRSIGKSDIVSTFLERDQPDDRLIFAKRTMNNQSRIVLTSGNRPVLDAFKRPDGALSRNSPFADRFLEALREGGRPRNFGVLTANEVYSAVLGLPVQPMVGQMGGTDGDFVFVPIR